MTDEIEWRRNWKPSLETKSWKPLSINNSKCLMKYLFTDSSYEIVITNLTNAWFERTEEGDVIQRAKVCGYTGVYVCPFMVTCISFHAVNVSLQFCAGR